MSFFNWFLNPVKNHYADFTGRVPRKEYWMFVLVYVLISIAIGLVEAIIGTNFLGIIFGLAILIPSIAMAARRLHDTGLSGWWQLVSLVPILGAIVLIVLLIRKGTAGPNKYGADPHATPVTSPTQAPVQM